MTPTHQSLDPRAPIGRKIELWLIVKFELVAFERPAQLALEQLAALHFGIEIKVVEPDLPPALVLRPIQRAISTRDQLVGIVAALWKERHTDADPDLDFAVADAEWLGHEFDRPLRKFRRPRRACDIGGNDGKLVTAEARERVAFTKGGS